MRPRPASPLHVLVGFVTAGHWSARLPGFEQWLTENPARPLVLECNQVTGFSPQALTDLACLVRTSNRRIHLRNWRTEFVKALLPQLRADRATLAALANRLEALEAALNQIREGLEQLRTASPSA